MEGARCTAQRSRFSNFSHLTPDISHISSFLRHSISHERKFHSPQLILQRQRIFTPNIYTSLALPLPACCMLCRFSPRESQKRSTQCNSWNQLMGAKKKVYHVLPTILWWIYSRLVAAGVFNTLFKSMWMKIRSQSFPLSIAHEYPNDSVAKWSRRGILIDSTKLYFVDSIAKNRSNGARAHKIRIF